MIAGQGPGERCRPYHGFEDAGNEAAFGSMARRLRPGGVLVVDVWNPAFHEARQGERTLEREGRRVRERKTVGAGRLRTELDYGDGATDVHDFRLYEPDELERLAAAHGLERVLQCTWMDESRAPTTGDARFQLVMRRRRRSPGGRSHRTVTRSAPAGMSGARLKDVVTRGNVLA